MTSLRTVTGTPAFTAPEVLGYGDIDDDTYASYTNAVDIWAVGVIAFLILTGETLFRDRRRLASYANQKMEFPIDTLDRLSIGEDAINFVRISMAPKPQHRPNAKESLDHPWFQEMSDVDSSEVNWYRTPAKYPYSPTASGTDYWLGHWCRTHKLGRRGHSVETSLLRATLNISIGLRASPWSSLQKPLQRGALKNMSRAFLPDRGKLPRFLAV